MEKGLVNLKPYSVVDLAFGLQKDDYQLGLSFKTFTPTIRQQIESFTKSGGAILASGSFLGSDMQQPEEQAFMQNVLKLCYKPSPELTQSSAIRGLGLQFDIYRTFNEQHYAATHPQVLEPSDGTGAICAMQYDDGTSAGVGYKGAYSTFTMGFPFECITDKKTKARIMQGILAYLLSK